MQKNWSHETSINPRYAVWVAATGGGPNWEFMAWIAKKQREWLVSVCNTPLGAPVFSFDDWLEVKQGETNVGRADSPR